MRPLQHELLQRVNTSDNVELAKINRELFEPSATKMPISADRDRARRVGKDFTIALGLCLVATAACSNCCLRAGDNPNLVNDGRDRPALHIVFRITDYVTIASREHRKALGPLRVYARSELPLLTAYTSFSERLSTLFDSTTTTTDETEIFRNLESAFSSLSRD
ncbi:unnamed protein product [Trichogramma brassicae]|uniref:Uncharacterized protein n=1 Tax=Trichogramma brassicae TaxID=86971 RepID=A0A6H5HWC8_9HYME|nr:unnamed protein product [Trichogramma brassicae]